MNEHLRARVAHVLSGLRQGEDWQWVRYGYSVGGVVHLTERPAVELFDVDHDSDSEVGMALCRLGLNADSYGMGTVYYKP